MASSSRTRRVAKELSDIESDSKISNISAQPADSTSDLTHLKANISGPPGTPYEGGSYIVDVKIPTEYPFRPPIMKFDTKVWHPNISSQTVSPARLVLPACMPRLWLSAFIPRSLTVTSHREPFA
jgi:ubiquitin-conjugating enzyme (huntingtin interacting protein 2)